jgi:hypothetical protein
VKVGDLVRIKVPYHLQFGQDPIGLVLNSSVHRKNGLPVYDVQLFGAYLPHGEVSQRVEQFRFYDKDLEVVSESR